MAPPENRLQQTINSVEAACRPENRQRAPWCELLSTLNREFVLAGAEERWSEQRPRLQALASYLAWHWQELPVSTGLYSELTCFFSSCAIDSSQENTLELAPCDWLALSQSIIQKIESEFTVFYFVPQYQLLALLEQVNNKLLAYAPHYGVHKTRELELLAAIKDRGHWYQSPYVRDALKAFVDGKPEHSISLLNNFAADHRLQPLPKKSDSTWLDTVFVSWFEYMSESARARTTARLAINEVFYALSLLMESLDRLLVKSSSQAVPDPVFEKAFQSMNLYLEQLEELPDYYLYGKYDLLLQSLQTKVINLTSERVEKVCKQRARWANFQEASQRLWVSHNAAMTRLKKERATNLVREIPRQANKLLCPRRKCRAKARQMAEVNAQIPAEVLAYQERVKQREITEANRQRLVTLPLRQRQEKNRLHEQIVEGACAYQERVKQRKYTQAHHQRLESLSTRRHLLFAFRTPLITISDELEPIFDAPTNTQTRDNYLGLLLAAKFRLAGPHAFLGDDGLQHCVAVIRARLDFWVAFERLERLAWEQIAVSDKAAILEFLPRGSLLHQNAPQERSALVSYFLKKPNVLETSQQSQIEVTQFWNLMKRLQAKGWDSLDSTEQLFMTAFLPLDKHKEIRYPQESAALAAYLNQTKTRTFAQLHAQVDQAEAQWSEMLETLIYRCERACSPLPLQLVLEPRVKALFDLVEQILCPQDTVVIRGGYVRDRLARRRFMDVDMVIDGGATALLQLTGALQRQGVQCKIVGNTHQTLMFSYQDLAVDISCNDPNCQPDFTMNTLSVNSLGEILDPESGYPDIKHQRIVFNYSPNELESRLSAAPNGGLYILRALKFHARFMAEDNRFFISPEMDRFFQRKDLLNKPLMPSMRTTYIAKLFLTGSMQKTVQLLQHYKLTQLFFPPPATYNSDFYRDYYLRVLAARIDSCVYNRPGNQEQELLVALLSIMITTQVCAGDTPAMALSKFNRYTVVPPASWKQISELVTRLMQASFDSPEKLVNWVLPAPEKPVALFYGH